jgi:hypothetical protein
VATIITGRNLTITIDSDNYDAQVQAVSLVPTNNTETWQTLAGPTAKLVSTSWELQVKGFQDWNSSTGMAAALWAAAATGTPIAFTMTADGPSSSTSSWSGDLIPVYPTAGGDASEALAIDITFPVDGTPTFTP